MLGNRPMSDWIAQYALSHQHPVNRFCHTVGIPLIAASVPLFVAAVFVHGFWPVPLGLFVVGWAFQFIGHEQAQRHRPEPVRSEEHTSELQSRSDLVCRLLLEKKKDTQ